MQTTGDIVGVRAYPTVVRLEESVEEPWIGESYCLTPEVRGHLDALAHFFAQESGIGTFLIGQYGSGKSHLLAYLAQKLRAAELGEKAPVDVVVLSLLNYRADTPLEDVIGTALGIPVGRGDRRVGWARCMQRHERGLVLILDELSEFLRSKPDRGRLNEDIRFLQYMGEWAQEARFFVIAAMQEAIEHAGDIEYAHFRKIQDRYPLRLRLTPSHVRELVAQSILVKGPGYTKAVEALTRRLREALPGAAVDFGALSKIYPIHPATLDLLAEMRDRFSQTRGVVEFVTRQLLGDPARSIPRFLDEPIGALITPDLIITHFQDVLEVQAEFLPLSQQLFPWYRKHLPEIFENEQQRSLAERLLRLLVLVHLAPAREGLSLDEASSWLLFAASRLDPARNRRILERVLQRLLHHGRYLRHDGQRYSLDLADDSTARLEKLLKQELADLPGPELCFELLTEPRALGPQARLDLFALPRDEWQPRRTRWSFHERSWSVYLGNRDPPSRKGLALCIRLPWGEAAAACGCTTVLPAAMELGPALREMAALARLRDRPLGSELARQVESRIAEHAEVFALKLSEAYARARVVRPDGRVADGLPPGPEDTLERWLDSYAIWMLGQTYPMFERFAPSHGPLPKEAYRTFMRFAIEQDMGSPDAGEWVRLLREAYLVPMGLLRRVHGAYELTRQIDRHELVRHLLPLIEHHVPISAVYDHLSGPVYGLVPDQIHLLLMVLLLVGELDVVKGQRSLRELYETLPTPLGYDRIVPGRALDQLQLRALEKLGDALHHKRPAHWTVVAQRRAIGRARDAMQEQAEQLRPLLARLEGQGELSRKLSELLGWCAVLERGQDELEAFAQLLYEVGSISRLLGRLGELSGLPRRVDRQLAELGRWKHLMGHPELASQAAELGEPPPLDEGELLDLWLKRAKATYSAYQRAYREQHDAWWTRLAKHEIWSWEPPAVSRCRQLGLQETLDAIAACRGRVSRCPGAGSLDFQPRCGCGFDGERVPEVQEAVNEMEELRARVERELGHFFRQEEVHARVRAWTEQGIEDHPQTRRYLEGQEGWPEIRDLVAFDEHLAGLEVARSVDLAEVTALLGERAWEPAALVEAFGELVGLYKASRLRFECSSSRDPKGVARWCVEQALGHGVSLPSGLGDLVEVAGQILPSWVRAPALARLEELGLDEQSLQRVLELIVERAIPLPRQKGCSPLVSAARELLSPTRPEDAGELAALSAKLYRHHRQLLAVARQAWLSRLEGLASVDLPRRPRPLGQVLEAHRDRSWLILDAFGLPILPGVLEQLDALLPEWELQHTAFAEVARTTTTDSFYRELAQSGLAHAFEKVNAIDDLLHERFLGLDDLCLLAVARLRVALGKVRTRIDPTRPLVLLGDHGFRMDPQGRSWTHGGTSTLERVVPVLLLRPR